MERAGSRETNTLTFNVFSPIPSPRDGGAQCDKIGVMMLFRPFVRNPFTPKFGFSVEGINFIGARSDFINVEHKVKHLTAVVTAIIINH